ncbi:hypothetical protein G4B88_021602 [Cannabis sativa]|uniref:Uncharacterized protein n=1 Tax=Cannabis sativa TaxID=3483 RepID=A0A7J6GL17_CANSA|nr:hypothetical protein G4B88_021602 [Cannabis sativa]
MEDDDEVASEHPILNKWPLHSSITGCDLDGKLFERTWRLDFKAAIFSSRVRDFWLEVLNVITLIVGALPVHTFAQNMFRKHYYYQGNQYSNSIIAMLSTPPSRSRMHNSSALSSFCTTSSSLLSAFFNFWPAKMDSAASRLANLFDSITSSQHTLLEFILETNDHLFDFDREFCPVMNEIND